MRELKFRAYDKVLNKYLFDGKSFYVLGETMLFDMIGQYLHENGRDSLLGLNDILLEQYIGLRDQNGREIYEGDIVALDEVWENQRYGVIEYNPYEGFGIYYNNRGYDCERFLNMHYFYELDICEMRVVCSKYENPELLEEV